MHLNTLKQTLSEKAKYPLYHDTYSGAIAAAIAYAESQGYEVDENSVWDNISIGTSRPKAGKTVRAEVSLLRKGEPVKNRKMRLQVYNMGKSGDPESRKFELNVYIS